MNEAIFVRTFDAPRQLVWDAWTKEENLREWFGPTGSQITHAKMDFRVGGSFHYAMKFGGGTGGAEDARATGGAAGSEHPEMWGLWTFREIDPPKRLQLIQNFSDKDRGVTSHPMSPTWPKKTLSTTTFSEAEGKTTLELRWEPFEATAEEIATFNAARPGMNEGWSGTFAQLDAYLAKRSK